MDTVTEPTAEEMLPFYEEFALETDPFIQVDQQSDNGYRHGTYEAVVMQRTSDKTFWEVQFNLSSDCEENGWRDGYAAVVRVYPITETVTTYTATEPK